MTTLNLSSRYLCTTLVFASILSYSVTAQADWYESKGHAVVKDGNSALAKRKATQDAIQQALLFAGASIKSVQQLTNGLLTDEQFEIRSNSEVNHLELVSESYSGDMLTVTIRADIFADISPCQQADYKKSLLTAWFPMSNRQHAKVGELFDISQHLQQQIFDKLKHSNAVIATEQRRQFIANPLHHDDLIQLGRDTHAQFLLTGEITSMAVKPTAKTTFDWFGEGTPERDFAIRYQVKDLTDGGLVFEKSESFSADYEFSLNRSVDSSSDYFWQSSYGQQIHQSLENMVIHIDEALRCKPAYGRVIAVKPEQLVIDMGRNQNLMVGDQLTLFQSSSTVNGKQSHYQHTLHPHKAQVKQIHADSAVLVNPDGLPFNNIQLFDYAIRRQ